MDQILHAVYFTEAPFLLLQHIGLIVAGRSRRMHIIQSNQVWNTSGSTSFLHEHSGCIYFIFQFINLILNVVVLCINMQVLQSNQLDVTARRKWELSVLPIQKWSSKLDRCMFLIRNLNLLTVLGISNKYD